MCDMTHAYVCHDACIGRPFSARELQQCDQWQDLRDVLESHLLDVSTSTGNATPRGWGGGRGGDGGGG